MAFWDNWFNAGGDKLEDVLEGGIGRSSSAEGFGTGILGFVGGSAIGQKLMGFVAIFAHMLGFEKFAEKLINKSGDFIAKASQLDEIALGRQSEIENDPNSGLDININPNDPNSPNPSNPNDPNVISVTNPGGFFTSLKEGWVGTSDSILTPDAEGDLTVDWGNVGESALNNTKAATVGAASGLGWFAGQIVDIADSTLNVLGAKDWIPDANYSGEWAENFTAVPNYVFEVEALHLGGAPDLSGAWAQSFNFAGSFVGPAAAFRRIGMLRGAAGGAGTPTVAAATTTTANTASSFSRATGAVTGAIRSTASYTMNPFRGSTLLRWGTGIGGAGIGGAEEQTSTGPTSTGPGGL